MVSGLEFSEGDPIQRVATTNVGRFDLGKLCVGNYDVYAWNCTIEGVLDVRNVS